MRAGLRRVLGTRLVGLYLYGSLVTGDFDQQVSDVDLLAALADDLTQADVPALDAFHADVIAAHPAWDNRLEIAYLSRRALQTFKTEISTIGIISPGEPFHLITGGIDWLMNWYLVQEHGVALDGPPPASLIQPTTQAEFVAAVRAHVLAWETYSLGATHRGAQAYAILTLCRGLYTLTFGLHPSKIQAAAWAREALPEWADVIDRALAWRRAQTAGIVEAPDTLAETQQFAAMVIARALSLPPQW